MLPDAVGTVSGYVVHFNPHLWPRTNQTMTSKVEMMQEKIKKIKNPHSHSGEQETQALVFSHRDNAYVYLLFASGSHSKEIRTKESMAF